MTRPEPSCHYEVATQDDFEACLVAGAVPIVRAGKWTVSGSATVVARDGALVKARDNAMVTAYDSVTVTARDSATITACGGATVSASGNTTVTARDRAKVTAYGSAQVTAYGSAQVTARNSATITACGGATVSASGNATVRAFDSATIAAFGRATIAAYDGATVTACSRATVTACSRATVTARDSAQVTAYDSVTVTARDRAMVTAFGSVLVRVWRAHKIVASASVVVIRHGASASIDGGTVIDRPGPQSAAEWCDYYGVPVKDGIAVLYKGVDAAYRSLHGVNYTPGTIPIAHDWDDGAAECGGGLHFSPQPILTHEFMASPPRRYVACPIALADMRPPRPGDTYPTKIKARGCAGPVWEVDINGAPVGGAP